MKSKDKIELKITLKDKVYLWIIFVMLIATILVCIYVPRYYKLKYNGGTTPSSSAESNNLPSSAPYTSEVPVESLKTCYSTKVLVILCPIGDMFANFNVFLNKSNYLDADMLHLDVASFNMLEAMAQPIYNSLNELYQTGELTQDAIICDNALVTSINNLKDALNNLYAKTIK